MKNSVCLHLRVGYTLSHTENTHSPWIFSAHIRFDVGRWGWVPGIFSPFLQVPCAEPRSVTNNPVVFNSIVACCLEPDGCSMICVRLFVSVDPLLSSATTKYIQIYIATQSASSRRPMAIFLRAVIGSSCTTLLSLCTCATRRDIVRSTQRHTLYARRLEGTPQTQKQTRTQTHKNAQIHTRSSSIFPSRFSPPRHSCAHR